MYMCTISLLKQVMLYEFEVVAKLKVVTYSFLIVAASRPLSTIGVFWVVLWMDIFVCLSFALLIRIFQLNVQDGRMPEHSSVLRLISEKATRAAFVSTKLRVSKPRSFYWCTYVCYTRCSWKIKQSCTLLKKQVR